MWLKWRSRVVLMSFMALAAVPVLAEDHESSEEATGAEHDGAEHSEQEHLHKHHIAVFIGATEGVAEHVEEHGGEGHAEGSSGGKENPGLTLGLDYERRFTRLFGIGAMVDAVVEGRREFLVGPIGFLHPFGGAKLSAAPLAERVGETGDWEFVFRVGAAWEFEVGKFSIAPSANYDMSEEHDLWVLGVTIGRGW